MRSPTMTEAARPSNLDPKVAYRLKRDADGLANMTGERQESDGALAGVRAEAGTM